MHIVPILVVKAARGWDIGQFEDMEFSLVSRLYAIAFTYVVLLIDAIRYRTGAYFVVNKVFAILVVVISRAMPIAIF